LRNRLPRTPNGPQTRSTGRSLRKLSSFIALERYIKASPAWQSLSLAARCAYLEFLDLYDGSNNGRLAMSANSLAAKLPVGRATANRAIQDPEDRGFIKAVKRGGFNVKCGHRRATEWRLTRYPCNVISQLGLKPFMRWQDGKFHLTVSPKSNSGLTTEPLN
jgi:hypothetical protein